MERIRNAAPEGSRIRGSVILPESGLVAVDADIVIYTVEKHPKYSPALRPLWESVAAGKLLVVISELILLETLVGPYRSGLSQLAADYETFLAVPGIQLVPISPLAGRGLKLAKHPRSTTFQTTSNVRKRQSTVCVRGCIRVQKSVFLGDLNSNLLDQLTLQLEQTLDPGIDRIFVFPICKTDFHQARLMGQAFDEKLVADDLNVLLM